MSAPDPAMNMYRLNATQQPTTWRLPILRGHLHAVCMFSLVLVVIWILVVSYYTTEHIDRFPWDVCVPALHREIHQVFILVTSPSGEAAEYAIILHLWLWSILVSVSLDQRGHWGPNWSYLWPL